MSYGQIPDKTIQKYVDQKLSRGVTGAQRKLTATVNQGSVTLTGTIQFEHHRRSILRAVGSVDGVRRVIDNLKVEPKKKQW